MPLLVFGILSLVSGILTAFLPETLNKVLPETLEQADEFGRPRCCGGGGRGGRNEGAPLLGTGIAGNLLRSGEQRSLLSEDDEDDELFANNTVT